MLSTIIHGFWYSSGISLSLSPAPSAKELFVGSFLHVIHWDWEVRKSSFGANGPQSNHALTCSLKNMMTIDHHRSSHRMIRCIIHQYLAWYTILYLFICIYIYITICHKICLRLPSPISIHLPHLPSPVLQQQLIAMRQHHFGAGFRGQALPVQEGAIPETLRLCLIGQVSKPTEKVQSKSQRYIFGASRQDSIHQKLGTHRLACAIKGCHLLAIKDLDHQRSLWGIHG